MHTQEYTQLTRQWEVGRSAAALLSSPPALGFSFPITLFWVAELLGPCQSLDFLHILYTVLHTDQWVKEILGGPGRFRGFYQIMVQVVTLLWRPSSACSLQPHHGQISEGPLETGSVGPASQRVRLAGPIPLNNMAKGSRDTPTLLQKHTHRLKLWE